MIYTDGSYNTGVAGWGFVPLHKKAAGEELEPMYQPACGGVPMEEFHGDFAGARKQTNNTGELQGIIMALWWILGNLNNLYRFNRVLVVTDSTYAIQQMTGRCKNTSSFEMVKNIQGSMLNVMEGHTLELMHVRAHLGDKWNDVADTFAKQETMPGDVEVVAKTAAWYQQYPMERLDEILFQEPVMIQHQGMPPLPPLPWVFGEMPPPPWEIPPPMLMYDEVGLPPGVALGGQDAGDAFVYAEIPGLDQVEEFMQEMAAQLQMGPPLLELPLPPPPFWEIPPATTATGVGICTRDCTNGGGFHTCDTGSGGVYACNARTTRG